MLSKLHQNQRHASHTSHLKESQLKNGTSMLGSTGGAGNLGEKGKALLWAFAYPSGLLPP